jgi:hypothetical protein
MTMTPIPHFCSADGASADGKGADGVGAEGVSDDRVGAWLNRY